MKKILGDIQSGRFAKDWMLENKVNQTSFKATRAKLAEHPIEQVGAKLREMMPWIKQRALVDRSRNSSCSRMEPTGPARSGRPDDRLREIRGLRRGGIPDCATLHPGYGHRPRRYV